MSDILFCSPDKKIFLLDIPRSIESSQGGGRVRSALPLQVPHVTPEPKGKKREVLLSQVPVKELVYQQRIEENIDAAWRSIAAAFEQKAWCLPRLPIEQDVYSHLCAASQGHDASPHIPVVLSSTHNDFEAVREVQDDIIVNSAGPTCIAILEIETTIVVPSHCTFIWSRIQHGLDVMLEYERSSNSRLQFDIILMDPPWPNRSVHEHYATMKHREQNAYVDALKIVQHFHAPERYVATWITNKPAIRRQVQASMMSLGFTLQEEWIWTKTTTAGEFVVPLNGLWRKPYEILLLFKHKASACSPLRRILFAVPDMHSRKPNLKTLFDMLIGKSCVLELFARNLTAGWWSLGDEVLKYQDGNLWHELADGTLC
ncbi:hypothetical protein LTS08_006476 [Lithohypha guttulata]|nr:hypothetical protein LTS08_006476 [Lithohypha guttulata]